MRSEWVALMLPALLTVGVLTSTVDGSIDMPTTCFEDTGYDQTATQLGRTEFDGRPCFRDDGRSCGGPPWAPVDNARVLTDAPAAPVPTADLPDFDPLFPGRMCASDDGRAC